MGYVLITGGNLINKGAQAMVFVAVDEVKRRFPKKEVVVISDVDAARSDEELAKYKFLFRDGVCIYGWKYKLLQHRYGRLDRHGDAAYIRKHTDMIIDISGYTFGSNWGLLANLLAAYRAPMALRMHCPIYFMPQSFGPFEWKGIRKKIADRYMRPWLRRARILIGREQQGCELLRRYYDLPYVQYAPDLVLTNRGVDRRELFKCPPRPRGEEPVPDEILARDWYAEEPEIPEIAPHSVGIVPNVRNDRYGGAGQMDALYRRAIDRLLETGRTVYIIRHAVQDRDVCRRIKAFYEKDQRVVLLEEEMDCFAYSALAARFDYLIASRYHAVVHAYKEGTPCIVPGWAVKYQELLKLFDQQDYEIDVRTQQPDAVDAPIARMEENYADEAAKIAERLTKLQRGNIFDILDQPQRAGGIRKSDPDSVSVWEEGRDRQCICCRICAVVCPADCIHFERISGYYLPIVDETLCIHCGKCARVCYGLTRTHRIPAAMPRRALTAQAKDEQLLMQATSGGVVTAMVEKLLRDGMYDNAYLVEGFDDEYQLRTREFLPGEDLSPTQKSRYVPVSQQNAVSGILAHPEKRSIYVGCACSVYGLLEAMKLSGASREHVLIIGLFCDRALTYSFYDYFRSRYPKRIKESGQIRDIYFRDKRAGGWPGNMRFVFEDGSSMDVSAKERMCVKDFFTLRRCVECDDKLNRQADISVGDNYTGKNSDKKGTSSVLLYTDRGAAAWEHCEDAFVTAPASVEEICESQHAEWEKAFACTKDGEKVDLPDEVVNDDDYMDALIDYALGELALYDMIPKYSKEKKKKMYQDALREKVGL